jgi:hypothetical protein
MAGMSEMTLIECKAAGGDDRQPEDLALGQVLVKESSRLRYRRRNAQGG